MILFVLIINWVVSWIILVIFVGKVFGWINWIFGVFGFWMGVLLCSDILNFGKLLYLILWIKCMIDELEMCVFCVNLWICIYGICLLCFIINW